MTQLAAASSDSTSRKKGFEFEMAQLAAASYKADPVKGWRILGETVTRTEIARKKLATLYRHKTKHICVLAFSGTDDGTDVLHDINALPTGSWCHISHIHQGFADAMGIWWKRGGKEQVKTLLTNRHCKDKAITTGHSLGGAKASLLAACANSDNGWLEGRLFGRATSRTTKDCHRVCHVDQDNGYCTATWTNPLRDRPGRFKNKGTASHSGCCAFGMGRCIHCCKEETVHHQWKEMYVYTFGAPAITVSQLTNAKHRDRCFRGRRFFNYDNPLNYDAVTSIATATRLKHPKMPASQLTMGQGLVWTNSISCNNDWGASAPASWLRAMLKPVTWLANIAATTLYHKMRMYKERIQASKLEECHGVCYVDSCKGTATNPIPWGATWKKELSRMTELIRHSVESALRESDSRQQLSAASALLDLTCDAVCEIDCDLKLLSHSPKLATMLLRRSGASLEGRLLTDFIAPGDAKRAKEILMMATESGGAAHAFHTHLVDSYSSKFRTEVFQVKYSTMDGRECHLLGLRDFTDLKSLAGANATDAIPDPQDLVLDVGEDDMSQHGSSSSRAVGRRTSELSSRTNSPRRSRSPNLSHVTMECTDYGNVVEKRLRYAHKDAFLQIDMDRETIEAASAPFGIFVGTSIRQSSLGKFCWWIHDVRKISTNNAHIHALGLDLAGRFCVSGAGDGRITVWALSPGLEPWVTTHSQQPILGVALAPDLTEEKLSLCAGGEDGRLVLHKRIVFGGKSVLHEGEGSITHVVWRSCLVAWMNDRGVKVLNMQSGHKVTYVERSSRTAKGSLAWLADDQLAMSWGSVVKVVVLLNTGDLQKGEVRHQFNCGDATWAAQTFRCFNWVLERCLRHDVQEGNYERACQTLKRFRCLVVGDGSSEPYAEIGCTIGNQWLI
eukprot:Skav219953  [mRNA]  locus=scaffold2879:203030:226979:+ [translate_table: standard]